MGVKITGLQPICSVDGAELVTDTANVFIGYLTVAASDAAYVSLKFRGTTYDLNFQGVDGAGSQTVIVVCDGLEKTGAPITQFFGYIGTQG